MIVLQAATRAASGVPLPAMSVKYRAAAADAVTKMALAAAKFSVWRRSTAEAILSVRCHLLPVR
jgi:hypothetical protein